MNAGSARIINAFEAGIIEEAAKEGGVFRSWLNNAQKPVADRLAKQEILLKGGADTGSCVSRKVVFHFELRQVPLKHLPGLYVGGVLKRGEIKNNLKRGDRIVFDADQPQPMQGGRVIEASVRSAIIEKEDGTQHEYTYEEIAAQEILWVHE